MEVPADMECARRQLSALLGRGSETGAEPPVSEAVVEAASRDSDYFAYLLASRADSATVKELLDHPPAPKKKGAVAHSNRELLARFARAVNDWATSGFEVADDATYERRLEACRRCPELTSDPPETLVQRLAVVAGMSGNRCRLCGCAVTPKARIATGECPAEDPERPSRTRWGDPKPEFPASR